MEPRTAANPATRRALIRTRRRGCPPSACARLVASKRAEAAPVTAARESSPLAPPLPDRCRPAPRAPPELTAHRLAVRTGRSLARCFAATSRGGPAPGPAVVSLRPRRCSCRAGTRRSGAASTSDRYRWPPFRVSISGPIGVSTEDLPGRASRANQVVAFAGISRSSQVPALPAQPSQLLTFLRAQLPRCPPGDEALASDRIWARTSRDL